MNCGVMQMKIIKDKISVRQRTELKNLQVENEKYKSQLDYLAMMNNIDLPEKESESDEQEVQSDQELL